MSENEGKWIYINRLFSFTILYTTLSLVSLLQTSNTATDKRHELGHT